MLLLVPIAQAEIEAEHWLKCFCFAMLKFIYARWINRSESCANFFDVRVVAPDGERQPFHECLSNRLVTFLGQPVQQAFQSQRGGSAAHTRHLVFYSSVVV